MAIWKLAGVLIMVGPWMANGQSLNVDSVEQSTYVIANLTLGGQVHAGKKVKLLKSPLAWRRLTDSLIQELVKRGRVEANDVTWMVEQSKESKIKHWSQTEFWDVKVVEVKKGKKIKRDTFGLSSPVFSRNRKVAIIYCSYLGPEMIHEECLVFVVENGSWKYYVSLYSIIS
jgi:hypothetical protein